MAPTVVTTFAILLAFLGRANAGFASFGQFCSDKIECDPNARLACEDKLCKCPFPNDMIFDNRRQKCLVLPGKICSAPNRSFYDCVENAYCNDDDYAKCICSYGYFKTFNGSCAPEKASGMTCSTGSECQEDQYFTCIKGACGETNATFGLPCGEDNPCRLGSKLTCINRTCGCPQSMVLQNQVCAIRAGAPCSGNSASCGDNALCLKMYPTASDPVSLSGRPSVCTCDAKLFPNSEGICIPRKLGGENCTSNEECLASKKLSCIKGTCRMGKASYGDTCGDEVHCDPRVEYSLRCANNSCQCTHRAVYDKATDNCLLRANQRCYYEELGLDVPCVSNAECDWNSWECSCFTEIGFYKSAYGFCLPQKKFGASCTGLQGECSDKLFLDCVHGVCTCNPKTTVLELAGGNSTCVRRAGEMCYDGEACVRNSKCKQNRCQCAAGYVKREDGFCGIQHGGKCGGTNLCGGEFACVEGKCECHLPFHQRFDRKSQKCISVVRGPCMEVVNGKTLSWACGAHAECSNSSGLHECKCTAGFVEGRDRMCVGTFGQACKGSGECDDVTGLKCWNGKCSCPTFQKYDKVTGKCKGEGKVGAKCNLDQEGVCVEGGFCDKFRGSSNDTKVGICHCKESYKPMANRTCSVVK